VAETALSSAGDWDTGRDCDGEEKPGNDEASEARRARLPTSPPPPPPFTGAKVRIDDELTQTFSSAP